MNRSEEALQRSVVSFLRLTLPEPWLVMHVPNGGGRSKAEAGILKAMGVLAGFPDLLLIGPHRVVAVELKAPADTLASGAESRAKPRLSEAQQHVIGVLGECGVPVLVCRSMPEVIAGLSGLGLTLRGATP